MLDPKIVIILTGIRNSGKSSTILLASRKSNELLDIADWSETLCVLDREFDTPSGKKKALVGYASSGDDKKCIDTNFAFLDEFDLHASETLGRSIDVLVLTATGNTPKAQQNLISYIKSKLAPSAQRYEKEINNGVAAKLQLANSKTKAGKRQRLNIAPNRVKAQEIEDEILAHI